jgi:16S rRNA processing protein RimM
MFARMPAAAIEMTAGEPTPVSNDLTSADRNWVVLAKLVRPQGRRGELLAEILTDFPDSFTRRSRVFLLPQSGTPGDAAREAKVESSWLHKGRVVLKFAGIDSIEDAEKLRHFTVVVPHEERMPLEGDAVYISDLLGAHVVDIGRGGSRDVGEITDVLPEHAGPAMLVLRGPGKNELLIPFVKAYLRHIDLGGRRVEMELPEGLLDIEAPLTEEERKRMQGELQGDS